MPCQHGGVCAAPNSCDCTGTGYSGSQCQNLIPTTALITTARALVTTSRGSTFGGVTTSEDQNGTQVVGTTGLEDNQRPSEDTDGGSGNLIYIIIGAVGGGTTT